MSATTSAYSKEQIHQMVYDIFDEFQKVIAARRRLHPSEEANRTQDYSKPEIYNIINAYHVHCQLCNQHFYSQSVLNDINSFFQKHINTEYHRSCKVINSYSDDKPILEWEKWLHTGHCNLCEISGIQAYLINSTLNVVKAIMFHTCYYDFEDRENNQKFIKKIELLRKYCTLSFFLDKFIRTVDENNVMCLLCSIKLVGTKKSAHYHLGSNAHFNNFCKLVWNQFQFTLKDLLNGFNLEMVTQWLVVQDMSFLCGELEAWDDKKRCSDESNSILNVYSNIKSNSSFSPKQIEDLLMLHSVDLVFNGKCLLCDASIENCDHMISESHLQKETNLNGDSFSNNEKYQIYQTNRNKRLQPHLIQIEMYNELKEDLGIYGLKIGMPYRPEFMNVLLEKNSNKKNVLDLVKINNKTPSKKVSDSDCVVNLIKDKLNLVENIYTELGPGYSMCHVCDQKIPTHTKNLHLSGGRHVKSLQNWKQVKTSFADSKFLEPIQKIKEDFVCLLCGIQNSKNSFISHIKGVSHRRKFEEYVKSNPSIPINLSFKFGSDDSCTCTNCASRMNVEGPAASLSSTLKNIKNHWPCTAKVKPSTEILEDFQKTLVSELESIYNTNKNVVAKNQSITPIMSVPCSTCGKPFLENEMKDHDCKMSFDFGGLQKTLRSFMDVFENKIMENIVDYTRPLIGSSGALNSSTAEEPKVVKILKRENTPKESTVSKVEINTSIDDESAENPVEEKCLEVKAEVTEKTDNDKNSMEEKSKTEKTDVDEDSQDEEHEVLIVMHVPKRERELQTFFFFFKRFGKIRYLFFEKGSVIIAFTQKGVAEKVAKESPIYIRDLQLDMMCTTRKRRSKATERSIPLHKDIVRLFEDPKEMMSFALHLMGQSIAMGVCAEEKQREELVCKTILSAVAPVFPNSRCFPFGSRLSGLFLSNSDFDVFLDCGGMYEGFKNTRPLCEQNIVREVARSLRKKRECRDLIVVERARVPIISFLHKPTMLHCDLSFKNGLSVQNTLLLKFILSLDWRIRPFILFLKHWADLNSIHGPPYFSSYAIAMMVIFYLQQITSPILPAIETLQKYYVGPRLTIGGWDCNFSTTKYLMPKITNKDPLLDLFLGFFEYYATFDYGKYVISPLLGKPLPREAFSDSSNVRLPMSIKRHIINIPFPLDGLVSDKIRICIMDPFDLSHILTKSFTKHSLQFFVHLCEKSAAHLKKGMNMS